MRTATLRPHLASASTMTTMAMTAFLFIGAFAAGCGRQVAVDRTGAGAGAAGDNGSNGGAAGGGDASGGAAGNPGAGGSNGGPGGSTGTSGAGGGTSAGGGASGSGGAVSVDGGGGTGNVLIGEINQNNPAAAALIERPQILAMLMDIQLPAVGTDGVSILQYPSTTSADVLHSDWNAQTGMWYASASAHYAYTAASGNHHLTLLYLPTTYGIYDDGNMNELSGTPATYKEFLSVNANGFAWVDYENKSRMPGAVSLGKIVFQTWGGARTTLTDDVRYRARPDLSTDHLVFVEYASTAPGTIGQIMFQPIAGGAATPAAPSAHHQDRPAVDGPWVVWEEYLTTTDAVIRARNMTSADVRNLSATTAFRTNPDIHGNRVVWEDQRSGNGDIYLVDLTNGSERPLITGAGHSSGPRQTADGLVWTETAGGKVALMYARWAP